MKVFLVSHTPEPEKLIAASARMCYSAADAETILDSLDPQKTSSFIDMLVEIGHESPVEHATFTFAIEGVSRSLLAQITRHRLASYSVQSQRYVKENNFRFVTPPEIEGDETAKAIYLKSMNDAAESYNKLADILSKKHYDRLIASGESEKSARSKAEKSAIEDARYVLPNACETKMMVTMNTRSLYNFFNQRCCYRAQWEIRELAWQMLALVKEVAPQLFAKAGPSCLNGPCKEGKMCCGRADEVRARV